MKYKLLIIVSLLICYSCSKSNETNTANAIENNTDIKTEDSVKQTVLHVDTVSAKNNAYDIISAKATILSVKEELLMPSDYLTVTMTVKTKNNDTLVFIDMFGFEKLVGQQIDIKYKMIPGVKLLVCFDCDTYSKPVGLFDITAFASDVTFLPLKLKEYRPDPYLVPASTFVMLKKDGTTEEFCSNENSLLTDTIKMTKSFYNYGVATQFSPELENRKELERLIK